MASNLLFVLLFSCIFLVVYYLAGSKNLTNKKILLLIGSVAFYLICDWKFFILLVCTICWTYFLAGKINGNKKLVAASIAPVILLLAFFKLATGTLELEEKLASIGFDSSLIKIIMPLGISYYVFKEISYTVDIYRGKYEPEKEFINYFIYVSFFPEIISGPISRFNDFKEKLIEEVTYSPANIEVAFYCILRGLFMKLVIANRLADYVSTIFETPEAYTGIALLMAAVFYSIELYCDFGGYSSIAIGITQALGMQYQENFVRPYFAINIKDFWRRWHVSLSTWLKDYVYISLGGNRCSKLRAKINVLITFLVSGMWHGAGLNFIVWGLWHGLLNVITPSKQKASGIKKVILVILNFAAVTIGWIFFGASSLQKALTFILRMFTQFIISTDEIQSAILPFTDDNTCVAFFLVVAGFIFIGFIRELYLECKQRQFLETPGILWQAFLLAAIILFGNFGGSGFIYANF